ncbi:beta-N-acetylglucosaminidase domain-containing protein [Mycoplasma sp. 394]
MNLKKLKTLLVSASAVGLLASISATDSQPATNKDSSKSVDNTNNDSLYQIFPGVQQSQYQKDKDFLITNDVNIIFEEGIDDATIARFDEVLKLKKLHYKATRRFIAGKTNILVGIKGDSTDDLVDKKVKEIGINLDDSLNTKIDSYQLDSKKVDIDGQETDYITVMAKNSDAAFYGATTLWHIFKQLDGNKIASFEIKDWADVKTRGVVEGYYGNPWSLQDRQDYMKWGSYYKLNAYMYSPKDDPKHRIKWRELYTQDELDRLIKPLAKLGNQTKVRFIYTLHPFSDSRMTIANYDSDLKVLKAKFKQVIDAGVRQIGVLGDDFGKPFKSGNDQNAETQSENQQKKFLEDLVSWLKELKKDYPDLVLTIPYVVDEYMGDGQKYFASFPPEVSVVMTSGAIFGTVNNDWLKKYDQTLSNQIQTQNTDSKTTANMVNPPLLWINWPVSDQAKTKLILGGYKNFLKPDVDASKFSGLLLNPMQQEQPSKVAIFGGANYAWKVWKSDAEADKIWENSFKHVLNNSEFDNAVSIAFREIAKHMIHQDQSNLSPPQLQESQNIKDIITTLQNKLSNDSFTDSDINSLIDAFNTISNSLKIFSSSTLNPQLIAQMKPWLDSFKELSAGITMLLNGLKSYKNGEPDNFIEFANVGKNLIDASKKHSFDYLGNQLNAIPGSQYIQPLAQKLIDWTLNKINNQTLQPSSFTSTFITEMKGKQGNIDPSVVFNKDNTTQLIYTQSNDASAGIKAGDWFGARFNHPISLHSVFVKFVGAEGNHFLTSKLQYQINNSDQWVDVPNQTSINYSDNESTGKDISFNTIYNVIAIRLYDTEEAPRNNKNLRLLEFRANPDVAASDIAYTGLQFNQENTTMQSKDAYQPDAHSGPAYLTDNKLSTEGWYSNAKNGQNDTVFVGDTLGFSLPSKQLVTSIRVEQAWSKPADALNDFIVEYKDENETDPSKQWKQFGAFHLNNQQIQYISGYANAKDFRFKVVAQQHVWWRLADISVYGPNYTSKQKYRISSNMKVYQDYNLDHVLDANDQSFAWLSHSDNGNVQNSDYVDIDFKRPMQVASLRILQENADKVHNIVIQAKRNNLPIDSDVENITDAKNDQNINIPDSWGIITGIRIKSKDNLQTWWKLHDVSFVEKPQPSNKYLFTDIQSPNLVTDKIDNTFKLFNQNNPDATSNITVAKDKFIGIDLGDVYNVDSITKDITNPDTNLKLQYSSDGYQWTDVENTLSAPVRMQFVRLINKKTGNSDTNLSVTFKNLQVHIIDFKTFGYLVSSTIANNHNNTDTRNSNYAFDGDINTSVSFTSTPKKDNEIIYDLGQQIDLKSLRIYASKSTSNYPRNIEVLASATNETSAHWTSLFSINDTVDSTNNLANVQAGTEDPKYPNAKYWGKDDISTKARYIKLKITKDYPANTSLTINEILVNKGVYIPADNDPRFGGENYSEISKDTKPANTLDSNLNTYYEPKNAAGKLIWYIEKGYFDNRNLRVVSDGDSYASVYVNILDTSTNAVEKKLVGKLFTNIVAFKLPHQTNKAIISVEIDWDASKPKPKITELIGYDIIQTAETDKNALKTLVQENIESTYNNWTKESKANYDAIKAIAHEAIKDDELLTQKTIDDIKTRLENAKSSALTKTTKQQQLQDILNSVLENTDNVVYTLDSYSKYQNTIDDIKAALKNTNDLTDSTVTSLKQAYQKAKESLVVSDVQQQIAQLNIKNFDTINKLEYTESSYNLLKEKSDALKAELRKTNPSAVELKKLNDAYIHAYKSLVASVKGAKLLAYNEYLENDAYGFTDKYQLRFPSLSKNIADLINQQSVVISNPDATSDQIDEALASLKITTNKAIEQRNHLISKYQLLTKTQIPNTNNIYTTDSYADYSRVFNQIKNNLIDVQRITEKQINDAQSQITNAQDMLKINPSNLNDAKKYALAQLEKLDDKQDFANKINASDLTADKLSEILKQINDLYNAQETKKLQDQRNKTKALIDKIKDLKIKSDLTNQMSDADNIIDLQKIYLTADAQIKAEAKAQTDFDIYKENIKGIANQILDSTKKGQFIGQIDAATTKQQLDSLKTLIDKEINDEKQAQQAKDEKTKEQLDQANSDVDALIKKLPDNLQVAYLNKHEQVKNNINDVNALKDEVQKKIDEINKNQESKPKTPENPIPTEKPAEKPKQQIKASNGWKIAVGVIVGILSLGIISGLTYYFIKKKRK